MTTNHIAMTAFKGKRTTCKPEQTPTQKQERIKMSEQISVRITCKEIISYDQTVTGSDMEDSDSSPLTNYIDPRDVLGADGYEQVEAIVVDPETGAHTEPEDGHEW